MAKQIVPQGWLQLPLRATSPYPAHMATGTPQTLLLRWAAGDRAASHDLYFGDNKDAVEGGIAPTARLGSGELTYNPGALEWGKTYYWRVDEVNAAVAESPWKGVTWSFTTADFLVVDDFEVYTDTVNHEDAAAVTSNTWLEWKILLSRFSKVSPAKIKRMSIGVGTPGSVTPGGSGTIFVDDIRVVKP